MPRRLVFVLFALLSFACLIPVGSALQPTPAIDVVWAATAYAQLTETALPLPTVRTAVAAFHTAYAPTLSSQQTAIARITVPPSMTPTPTYMPRLTDIVPTSLQFTATVVSATQPQPLLPLATPLPGSFPTSEPSFEPTQVPGLLQSTLITETMKPFNNHGLRRVTGWIYGFNGIEWMDKNHLLLEPVVGFVNQFGGRALGTHPAIINIDSNKVWIPSPGKPAKDNVFFGPLLPRWSARLGIVIASGPQDTVATYSSDGELINIYNGNLLGVSPSATKILVDDTWIDLASGKIVAFAWNQNDQGITDAFSMRPIWSPDETRIYACCYLYGDAKTGESLEMPLNGISVDGKQVENYYGLYHFYGTWVLNGSYLLVQPGGVWDGRPDFVPLFDPKAKTYRNLNAVANVPYTLQDVGTPNCYPTSALSGGRYVWMNCIDGGHLVDLVTFKTQAYPGFHSVDIVWSADGKFAWIDPEGDGPVQILSTASKELKPAPSYSLRWHPTANIAAYLSNQGKTLSLLDAKTVAIQGEFALPLTFREIIWSPDGRHLALVAEDNSIWQIDYPKLENLEQLTSAMPGSIAFMPYQYQKTPRVRNIVWSPDGTSLAFIGDMDIYIVDTRFTP